MASYLEYIFFIEAFNNKESRSFLKVELSVIAVNFLEVVLLLIVLGLYQSM